MSSRSRELPGFQADNQQIPRVPLGVDGMHRVELLYHNLPSGLRVYNPTMMLDTEDLFGGYGYPLVVGRVERPTDEFSSQLKFFSLRGTRLIPLQAAPTLDGLQDPSITTIRFNGKRKVFLGGIEVEPRSNTDSDYRTVMYEVSKNGLEPIARGPEKGKCLRLVQNPYTGELWMFIRPQGEKWGGLGEMGCAYLNGPNEINENSWNSAQLIPGLYPDGYWGGANHAEFITPEHMLVEAHRACFNRNSSVLDDRRYISELLVYEPKKNKVLARQDILTAAMLPSGLEVGRQDCSNVTYPGAFYRTGPTTLDSIFGAMDAHAVTARQVKYQSLLARAGILQTVLAQ
jgi:hypothetical protein